MSDDVKAPGVVWVYRNEDGLEVAKIRIAGLDGGLQHGVNVCAEFADEVVALRAEVERLRTEIEASCGPDRRRPRRECSAAGGAERENDDE